jgi:hypothetical protein
MDSCEIERLTGSDMPYAYEALLELGADDEIRNYIKRTHELVTPIARDFDERANTEWLIRSYIALKFVLGATLLGNSALHARADNVQVCLPYLTYYTMLNCARAFILTLPCVDWKGLVTIEATHRAILRSSSDKLKRLGARHAHQQDKRLWAAKSQRDLFSYRFPASGLAIFGGDLVTTEDAIQTAKLFVDLAQVNLSCLEAKVRKFQPEVHGVSEVEDVWNMMRYDGAYEQHIDDEDYYQVGRFIRRKHKVASLIGLAREGLVDDFFGAWSDPDRSDGFSPDHNINLLLDLW